MPVFFDPIANAWSVALQLEVIYGPCSAPHAPTDQCRSTWMADAGLCALIRLLPPSIPWYRSSSGVVGQVVEVRAQCTAFGDGGARDHALRVALHQVRHDPFQQILSERV